MPSEGSDWFARCQIPHFDGVVITPGSERLAVGAETDTIDGFAMPSERGDFFARCQIPHFDGVIMTRGSERLAIGAETDTPDR